MYAVHFAKRYLGTKNIYAVEYDKYDENNLGNKYLIERGIAKPITIEVFNLIFVIGIARSRVFGVSL